MLQSCSCPDRHTLVLGRLLGVELTLHRRCRHPDHITLGGQRIVPAQEGHPPVDHPHHRPFRDLPAEAKELEAIGLGAMIDAGLRGVHPTSRTYGVLMTSHLYLEAGDEA